MPATPFDRFFKPRSVAVIGASHDPTKVGYLVLKNMIDSGYQGQLYPINPDTTPLLGYKTYARITDVPTTPDLVIIIIPAQYVASVLVECGQKGVTAVMIISAGFKEAGPVGQALEQKIVTLAQQYGIRLIGPNCLGLINTARSLNATFSASYPSRGSIAFLSQSGALGTAVLDVTTNQPLLGLSLFVSLGNKADVSEIELLNYLKTDPQTNVILSYSESLPRGTEFMKVAERVTKVKPVVMLKSGSTASGQQAVSSHTGSLAGSDQAYTAALKQSGVIRVETLEELFDVGKTLAHQPVLRGKRILIVTNAGGPGILASDMIEKHHLELAQLSHSTIERLKRILPAHASFHNPIDILGDAPEQRYCETLKIVSTDRNVDGIVVILTPQATTEIKQTAQVIGKISKLYKKPIVTAFMGDARVSQGLADLNRYHIPNFAYPERAIKTFSAIYHYHLYRTQPRQSTPAFRVNKTRAQEIVSQAQARQAKNLTALESYELLHCYRIPVPATQLATSAAQAERIAKELGYPVVLKIESPAIVHKTEIKGVKVGLGSGAQVTAAYHELMARATHIVPQAQVTGCVVQTQAQPGIELLIGMKRDPHFGPVVAFGWGGIYVEALKDLSFRVAPFTTQDALDMIAETKAAVLINGARGQAPIDKHALADILLKVGQLAIDVPAIQSLDLNPVLATPDQIMAVDFRIMV